MPDRGVPLRRLGFLTIGQFDAADPGPGHEQTLRMIERAEELGFDSVWVRQRHFQPGISSPVALLAAASQRTNRIALGTAVIPLGLENPLRLAEDLATVDSCPVADSTPACRLALPFYTNNSRPRCIPRPTSMENFSKETRTAATGVPTRRARQRLRGDDWPGPVLPPGTAPLPGSGRPGLVRRRPALGRVAGSHGLNYLTANLVSTEGTESREFATIQAEQSTCFARTIPIPNRRESHRDWW